MNRINTEQKSFDKGGTIPGNRLPMLDVVRAFAAISVFFYHAYYDMSVEFGAVNGYFSQANICMTLFFLLSGFLLAYTGRNKNYGTPGEIGAFLKKRLVTLLPLYCLISIYRLVYFDHYSTMQLATALPYEILPTFTLINFYGFSLNGGLWFVADILFAYALFPFLIKPIRRLKLREAVCVFWGLYLLRCTMENIQTFFADGPIQLYKNPFPRVMEFFMGAVLCYVFFSVREGERFQRKQRFSPGVLRLAVIVLLALLVILTDCWTDLLGRTDRPINGNLPFATIPLFTAILLVSAFSGDMPRFARPLSFLSKLSYPLWMATNVTTHIMNQKLSGVTSRILSSFLINLGIALILYGFQFTVESLLHRLEKWIPRYRRKLICGILLLISVYYFAVNVNLFIAPAKDSVPRSAYDFEHALIRPNGSLQGFFNDEGDFAWAGGEASVCLALKKNMTIKVRTSAVNIERMGKPPLLEIAVGVESLGSVPLSTDIKEITFAVPENLQGKTAVVNLRCDATFVPKRDIANSDDGRELSFQIFYIGEK